MIVRKCGDWLSAQVGEELVMMSAEKGDYLGLSPVGARIWALIEESSDVDDICARLVQEFDVEPDVCRAEVDAFFLDLVKHGAATIDPPQTQ